MPIHVAFAWGDVSDRRTAAERGERAVGLAAVRTHHPKNGKWGAHADNAIAAVAQRATMTRHTGGTKMQQWLNFLQQLSRFNDQTINDY